MKIPSGNQSHLPSHFHRALAESIERAVDFPPGMLVTLVSAEITGSARFAKGIVSVLPESQEERAISMLIEADGDIKEELNRRIRLRITPSLHWEADHTEAKAAELERTMNELKARGEL